MSFLPKHGGDVIVASAYWKRPLDSWLDLSTGINPYAYPLDKTPEAVWHHLPYDDYGLTDIAAEYFKRRVSVVVPGSQFAIEQIPQLLSPKSVAIPTIGYSEYGKAWQAKGHTVCFYNSLAHLLELLESGNVEHCILINPNNPTAENYSIKDIQQVLSCCQGYCLIDEAFRDLTPNSSSLVLKHERLIVLRSLGKFFGLAGLRVGFVFANEFISQGLKQSLGLWPISTPSLWGASAALKDRAWQRDNCKRIGQLNANLEFILQQKLPANWESAGLFISAKFEKKKAHDAYERLAQQGILIRYFDLPNAQALLRFGLPKYNQIARFEAAF